MHLSMILTRLTDCWSLPLNPTGSSFEILNGGFVNFMAGFVEDYANFGILENKRGEYTSSSKKLGQPIRLLLNYVGEEFKDLKYEMGEGPEFSEDQWLNVKFTLNMDYPNIPYYIDGDVRISQSNAILMYLGRKYNMAGDTEAERIMVDVTLNHAMDVRVLIDNATYDKNYAELKKPLFEKLQSLHLPLLEKRLTKTQNWFIGEKITVADFPLYEILDNLRVMEPGCIDTYPYLTAFLSKFESLPNIKTYMTSGRFMRSPINNKFASFIG